MWRGRTPPPPTAQRRARRVHDAGSGPRVLPLLPHGLRSAGEVAQSAPGNCALRAPAASLRGTRRSKALAVALRWQTRFQPDLEPHSPHPQDHLLTSQGPPGPPSTGLARTKLELAPSACGPWRGHPLRHCARPRDTADTRLAGGSPPTKPRVSLELPASPERRSRPGKQGETAQ